MSSLSSAVHAPEPFPPAEAGAGECAESRDVLVFTSAGRRCAIALRVVREIVHLPALVRPAGLPSPVVGFFKLAREAVAVLDTRRILGAGPGVEDVYTPLLVLRDDTLALMVDDVEGMLHVDVDAMLPLESENSLNGCACAVVDTEAGGVQLLDARRLLFAAERERVAALESAACKRLAEIGAVGDE